MTTVKNSLFTVITEKESATVSGGSNLSVDTGRGVAYGGNLIGSLAILSGGIAFVNVDLSNRAQYEAYLNANPDLRRIFEAAR
ncbi:hypothetical protein [Iningainema tapete]|uniref:Uncharacterized protein n=1 Tax=Iningainema tapete BLCC-T55 TaxID=2748662 RepID=A0A8J7C4H9_9CYAN|nr:hypothetical protein [Iningainema tapete]MBD2771509.1 hypothetical protein [Iningainema tapete BLCC-T55]